MIVQEQKGRFFYRDSSAISLILSNLVVMALAVFFNWSIATILWIYWLQSIIIGIFIIIKVLFGPATMFFRGKTPGQGLLRASREPIYIAGFVALFLGVTQFFYAMLILTLFGQLEGNEINEVILGGAIFFITHLFSFLKNYVFEKNAIGEKIDKVFFLPFFERVISLFLVVMLGALIVEFAQGLPFASLLPIERGILVAFMLFKTATDVMGHVVLHKKDVPAKLGKERTVSA